MTRNVDDFFTRVTEAGLAIEDLLDECEVCGELIYRDTCDCTYAYKLPSRVRFHPWDDRDFDRTMAPFQEE